MSDALSDEEIDQDWWENVVRDTHHFQQFIVCHASGNLDNDRFHEC